MLPEGLSPVDTLCIAILLIAIVRGMFIGMIREGFSIAALAAGCIAVVYAREPVTHWLIDTFGESSPWIETAAPWIAGGAIFVIAISLVGLVGRIVKRGARAAGLDWADRLGGGALGAAEGAIVVAVLISVLVMALGRSHPSVEESRSVEAVDTMRAYLGENFEELPAVGAPPRS